MPPCFGLSPPAASAKPTLCTSLRWFLKLLLRVVPPQYAKSFGELQRVHVAILSPVFSYPKSQTADRRDFSAMVEERRKKQLNLVRPSCKRKWRYWIDAQVQVSQLVFRYGVPKFTEVYECERAPTTCNMSRHFTLYEYYACADTQCRDHGLMNRVNRIRGWNDPARGLSAISRVGGVTYRSGSWSTRHRMQMYNVHPCTVSCQQNSVNSLSPYMAQSLISANFKLFCTTFSCTTRIRYSFGSKNRHPNVQIITNIRIFGPFVWPLWQILRNVFISVSGNDKSGELTCWVSLSLLESSTLKLFWWRSQVEVLCGCWHQLQWH